MSDKQHRPLSQIQSDLAKAKNEAKAIEQRRAALRAELEELVCAATDIANTL
jgi:septal ring factor EnvC (AmiA/AmiB activator)